MLVTTCYRFQMFPSGAISKTIRRPTDQWRRQRWEGGKFCLAPRSAPKFEWNQEKNWIFPVHVQSKSGQNRWFLRVLPPPQKKWYWQLQPTSKFWRRRNFQCSTCGIEKRQMITQFACFQSHNASKKDNQNSICDKPYSDWSRRICSDIKTKCSDFS